MHFLRLGKYQGVPKIMEKEKCEDLSWFNIDNLPDNTIKRIKNVLKNMQYGIIYDDGEFSRQKLKEKELNNIER